MGIDRDLAFVHGLKQCGLGLGSGAVDLVGQQNVGENRSAFKLKLLLDGGVDRDAENVRPRVTELAQQRAHRQRELVIHVRQHRAGRTPIVLVLQPDHIRAIGDTGSERGQDARSGIGYLAQRCNRFGPR